MDSLLPHLCSLMRESLSDPRISLLSSNVSVFFPPAIEAVFKIPGLFFFLLFVELPFPDLVFFQF